MAQFGEKVKGVGALVWLTTQPSTAAMAPRLPVHLSICSASNRLLGRLPGCIWAKGKPHTGDPG